MSITDDATTLLLRLAQMERTTPAVRDEFVSGSDLDNLLQMGPHRLSDAVAHLESNGYLEVLKTFGTAPYDFNSVSLTSRGRFEAEQLTKTEPTQVPEESLAYRWSLQRELPVMKLAQPVGSPYGFPEVAASAERLAVV